MEEKLRLLSFCFNLFALLLAGLDVELIHGRQLRSGDVA